MKGHSGNGMKVFSFDLGTGSMGVCVREDQEIKHLDVKLLPSDFASTKDSAQHRRMIRTRIAHKAREEWWKKCAKDAGIPVPDTTPQNTDNPFQREFPEEGDKTIYTSCLLRIALIQGAKLEGWQVYKAIHSAIQRRGYDNDIAWKTNDNDRSENEGLANEYEKYCRENRFEEKYCLPCYVDAHKMGLWSPDEPDNLTGSRRNETNPNPARNKDHLDSGKMVVPRKRVEDELNSLLEHAAKLFPKLTGKEKYVIYGPGEVQYASIEKSEFHKFRGKKWDWQGLLGQKIPRFDNRIITKCCCMPRFNVCRADDILNLEVMFLLTLKNMRYSSATRPDEMLTAGQLKELFEAFKERLEIKKNENGENKSRPPQVITENAWKKWIKNTLGGSIHPAHLSVSMPAGGGRSRYCRPALKIIKELILSGKSPKQMYEYYVAENKKENPEQSSRKGLIQSDFDFLIKQGAPEQWENFHISDNRYELRKMSAAERQAEIKNTIDEINNPVVRHRLWLFKKELDVLAKRFGIPTKIVLEFARDEFMGKIAKTEYDKFLKAQTKERQTTVKELEDAGFKKPSGELIRKMMLFRQQNGTDYYSLLKLTVSKLDEYEIDHIIPRSKGGPDAFYNITLTTGVNNSAKGDKIPSEWLSYKEIWSGICKELESNDKMGSKKQALFMASSEEQYKLLIDKYTFLAETAYISKLAQKISALTFDWGIMTKGDDRNIIVATGGQTARIRSRFKLDRLLHPPMSDDEFYKLLQNGEIEKKNRENPRHHALDALVLSVMPEVRTGINKRREFDDIYPDWFTRELCERELSKTYPKQIKFSKGRLAEVIYGKRVVKKEDGLYYTYAVTRQNAGTKIEEYEKLSDAKKWIGKIFSDNIRKDFQKKLDENPTEEQWREFIRTYKVNGSRPRKVSLIGNPRAAGVLSPQHLPPDYHEISPGSGQYYETKTGQQFSYTAQLACLNEQGKWEVHPVYAWDSEVKRIAEAMRKFKRVVRFRSHQSVEIKNDCANGRIKKGIYILISICNGIQVVLEAEGQIVRASINELMNTGGMCPIT